MDGILILLILICYFNTLLLKSLNTLMGMNAIAAVGFQWFYFNCSFSWEE